MNMNKQKLLRFIPGIFFCFQIITLHAAETVGTIVKVTGKPGVIRNRKTHALRINENIFLKDVLITKNSDGIVLTLNDIGKVRINNNREISVEQIIEYTKKNLLWTRHISEKLNKILSKDPALAVVPANTTGVRGQENNNDIARYLLQIENALVNPEFTGDVPDLLLIKSECLRNLGRTREALEVISVIREKFPESKQAAEAENRRAVIDALSRGKLAVVGFAGNDENYRIMISGQLSAELSLSGQIQLVEREIMDEILQEHILLEAGVLSKRNVLKFREISGADYLLSGTYTIINNSIGISCNLVDVYTAEILKSWRVSGEPEKIPYLLHQLSYNVHRYITGFSLPDKGYEHPVSDTIKNATLLFGFNKPGEIPVYRAGEILQINFFIHHPSKKHFYITVLNISTEGDINILYPNQCHQDNKVTANTAYTIPEVTDDFELEAYGAPGKSVVVGIVTEQPFYFFDKERLKNEVFPEIKEDPAVYLRGGIKVTLKEKKAGTFVMTRVFFEVE